MKKIYEIPQEVDGETRTYEVKAKTKEQAEVKAIKLAIKELKKGTRKYSSRAISEKTVVKPKRSKKLIAVTVIIFILFSVSTVSAVFYQDQFTHILSSYNELETDYNSLSSQYTSLQTVYDNKVDDYNYLENRYNLLDTNYNSLESTYKSLRSNYYFLQTRYASLDSSYNYLENQYGTLTENYLSYKQSVEVRYGEGSDCQLFITPNDPSVIRATASVLGHHRDGECSWSDMRTINEWVGKNIEYNYDTHNRYRTHSYQYPSETLELKRGDCEDHAVLMVSMCKAEGNLAMYCALVYLNRGNGEDAHLCVFVNVADDQLYIFEPTDTSGWHSSSAKSEREALAEYGLACEASYINVIKIFNENMYKKFNNNQEFFDYF